MANKTTEKTAATILFVDNHEDFLQTRAEYLELAGYRVIPATSLKAAREAMESQPVDLAILDIRMMNDDDPKDVSGILLAKERRYAPIPKIILTDYPDYRTAREALGPVLDGMPAAVDYLEKKEGPQAMVDRVAEILRQRTLPEPVVHWEGGLSWPGLVGLLEPELIRAMEARIWELQRLLGACFPNAGQVILGPVYVYRPGYVCLAWETVAAGGGRERGVLAYARREPGEQEWDRYEHFVPQAPEVGATLRTQQQRWVHYTATVYRLVGADTEGEPPRPLAQVLPTLPVFHVEQVITALYEETLARWHGRGRRRGSMENPVEYFLGNQARESAFQEKVQALGRALEERGVARFHTEGAEWILHDLVRGDAVPLPFPWTAWQRGALPSPGEMVTAYIHGQVDLDHVLVDRAGHAWLIDFTQAREDFPVLDYIRLEQSIRQRLLRGLDLAERVDFESDLLVLDTDQEEGLIWEETDEPPDEDIRWQQAMQAILAVRRAAYRHLAISPEHYRAVLYGDTLKHLWGYDPEAVYTAEELMGFAHDLIVLSLTGQTFLPAPPADNLPQEALESIWLDADMRQAWVLGQPIALTPQEYTLLDYMLSRAGEVCTFKELSRVLTGDGDYEFDQAVEEHRIRSAINRLRRKIEPHPREPRFLVTVRGLGYRLVLES